MSYRVESLLIVLCVLITLNAQALSFSADAVQLRGTDISHARMFWKEGNVRFEYIDKGIPMVQIFDNSNNQMIWLDTDNKVETITPAMFAIPEDYKSVESQLTGLDPESAMTFGTADQQ